ncbi:MAG TPA: alpha/beta hydrolase [Caulobacteraceae bacterium]|nr:alpha/beta hydrolase [Caulobacteraceae bacterium]
MTTSALASDELVEMRGLRFHYRDWPSARPGARDLVLLHGFTGHARSWDAFAAAMTDRYRVLALDQRGHGESGWAPAGGYGAEEMVEDLRAFVAALGLNGFTLLGLSMGGNVAIHYAGARPRELAALVIVDIAPEIEPAGMGRIRSGVQSADVFASREAAFAAARAANDAPPEVHHRHRVVNNLMLTEDGRWTWRYDRALRSGTDRRRADPEAGWRACAAIAVPTLLIRGERSDILSPRVAQRMIDTIPGARLAVVEGSGHSVPLDAPDGFLAAARAFLQG